VKKTFLLLLITIFLSGCNRDDNKNNTLPPPTQTGVGTFACYINGKAFVDKNSRPQAYYQLVDGGYYFHIGGELKKKMNNGLWAIHIGTTNKTISESETMSLIEYGNGNARAGGGYIS